MTLASCCLGGQAIDKLEADKAAINVNTCAFKSSEESWLVRGGSVVYRYWANMRQWEILSMSKSWVMIPLMLKVQMVSMSLAKCPQLASFECNVSNGICVM